MSMESTLLAASYAVHLLATAVWAGGLLFMCLMVFPAWRVGKVTQNNWLEWQKRLTPWVNTSLMLLLISGFYQMTNDSNYRGFLTFDTIWAWAMLIKHVAYILLVVVVAWMQFGLYPAMARTAILAQNRPQLADQEKRLLHQQEKRLLSLNVILAVIILLCTAVATAV